MSDPFAARRRQAFMEQMPEWTADAACRDKVTVAGGVWEAAFTDDLTYKAQGEYRWPASTLEVLATCARCPVQRQCLAYGFKIEEPIKLGTRSTNDDEYDRLGKAYVEEWLTPDAVGVYGGIPGPMRERFRRLGADREQAAQGWFDALRAQRGWATSPDQEVVA